MEGRQWARGNKYLSILVINHRDSSASHMRNLICRAGLRPCARLAVLLGAPSLGSLSGSLDITLDSLVEPRVMLVQATTKSWLAIAFERFLLPFLFTPQVSCFSLRWFINNQKEEHFNNCLHTNWLIMRSSEQEWLRELIMLKFMGISKWHFRRASVYKTRYVKVGSDHARSCSHRKKLLKTWE